MYLYPCHVELVLFTNHIIIISGLYIKNNNIIKLFREFMELFL